MLKASALYIVIVIALVIAVLCSTLIVTGYYYKSAYQRKFRYDLLQRNETSGINILLGSDDVLYQQKKVFSLFGSGHDSVSLQKISWGIYELGLCRSFIQKDTVQKVFLIAAAVDSTKWAALYLIDEDRPLSLSGKTMIKGNVFIPKAGVKEAYVDGKAYQGDKRLVVGTKHDSQKSLPAPDAGKLLAIRDIRNYAATDTGLSHRDSMSNSFFNPSIVINFKKKIGTIGRTKLSGNIILLSDTTIIITNLAQLQNVIIYAKSISVEKGFTGNCQLFARDSIGIQGDCHLNYPSALGVLRFETDKATQGRIHIGENTVVSGSVFTYEKIKSQLQTIIDLDKNVTITGQTYVQGILRLKDGDRFEGSVFTNRFLYQSNYTTFENYLINAKIDEGALSPYYLTSSLFPVSTSKQKILQWLESK